MGVENIMCKECKANCIGATPCFDCGRKSGIVIPNWIAAGLIILLLYFMTV